MSISGGDLGFDEGGVLQALFSKPFYVNETVTVKKKYNRKGLLIKESTSTHTYDISTGDIVVAGIITGVIGIGIFSAGAIAEAAKDHPLGIIPTPQATVDFYSQVFGKFRGFLAGLR